MNKARTNEKKSIDGKKIIIIFISAFLALLVALLATLGIISLIRGENAVVTLDGASIDKGAASFFISRFKAQYLASMRKEGYDIDADDFWDSKVGDKSARENFEDLSRTYLKEILVTNYIFDSYRSLTREEKREIEAGALEVVEYHADGSVDVFNEKAAKYGFDFNDFKRAAIMMYKSNNAFAALYGDDGSNISGNASAVNSYLNEYAHVYIIMVREGTKLENGENYMLNDEERAERRELLDKIEAAMRAYESGGNGEMTVTSFEKWLTESPDSQNDFTTKGYYFHKDAAATSEFDEGVPNIAKRAMEMKLNSFSSITTKIKIDIDGEEYTETLHCFLYRTEPRQNAYADSDIADVWFSDFYEDLAVYVYKTQIDSFIENVEYGGAEESFDYVSVGANSELVLRG